MLFSIKQLLRSGTSIGANIHESKYAHGTADFVSASCSRFAYEPSAYDSNIIVDYTIDLDTHQIIEPIY